MTEVLSPSVLCKTKLRLGRKIMSAAVHLKKSDEGGFSLEDLVVQAWRMFPETFGLPGYLHDHPDSNKVSSILAGEKGLVRRGLLVRLGPKRYFVSLEGSEWTRMARDEEGPEPLQLPPSERLSRAHERLLSDMLSSTAHRIFADGNKADISFTSACGFWGLNPCGKVPELDWRLGTVKATLDELLVLTGDGRVQLTDGQAVSAGDIRALVHLDGYLRDRFDRHLRLMRGAGVGNR